MARYRGPMASQDLERCMLNEHSRSIPSSIFNDITNKDFRAAHFAERAIDEMSDQGNKTTVNRDPSWENHSGLNSEEQRNTKDDCSMAFVSYTSGTCHTAENLEATAKKVTASQGDIFAERTALLANGCSLELLGRSENDVCREKKLAEKLSHSEKDGKKFKAKGVKTSDAALQDAICLTVATAETLVIADMMNDCQTCQSLGPKAILDAALMLRRERFALGLDHFTLENLGEGPSPDLTLDDLDDMLLEEDCCSILQTSKEEQGPGLGEECCSMLQTCKEQGPNLDEADISTVQSSDKALTIFEPAKVVAENSSTSHLKVQLEESYHESDEVVQETINALSMLSTEQGGQIRCVQDHHVAPRKESFNSRWFGGWTGSKNAAHKPAGSSQEQTDKGYGNYLVFETSELSETCSLARNGDKPSSCSKDLQNKSPLYSVPLLAEADGEAPSIGSCAEILVALSQASVKSSLQEPLCSFVPCSVSVKVNPPFTQPESSEAKASAFTKENALEQFVNDLLPEDDLPANDELNLASDLLPYDNLHASNELNLMPENFPRSGTKRTHLNSLRAYSTITPVHETENTLQPREQSYIEKAEEKLWMQLSITCHETANAAEIDNSTILLDKNRQCELMLEDSAFQDSPPLIWHRGKRRRLRACRIVESDLTQAEYDKSYNDLSPHVGKNCSELEIVNIETCEGHEMLRSSKVHQQPFGRDSSSKSDTSNRNKESLLQGEVFQEDGTRKSPCKMTSDTEHNEKGCKEGKKQGINSLLFKGFSFLVTGFPANQKDLCEKICKKIQDHGGVINSNIPSLSSQIVQKKSSRQHLSTSHCIVIAPQKVRTLKYLYACAAGLLIVKPNWVDEVMLKDNLLQKQKSFDKEGTKQLIFSRIVAFIHGEQGYSLKLSLLIQHGAGKVVKSMRALLQSNNVDSRLIHIVIAEHQNRLSQTLKERAQQFGLPIVSRDWIIDSLLKGRLCPLPRVKDSNGLKLRVGHSDQGISRRNTKKNGQVAFVETRISKRLNQLEEVNEATQCVSFLGRGGSVPTLCSMGLKFVLDVPEPCTLRKVSWRTYYKSICIGGIIYSAGDIVEVRPQSGEDTKPYVAQIESFYSCYSRMNTRAMKGQLKVQPESSCLLCCRWFYRPSDTGFPSIGNEKELYLSQHFDDSPRVCDIIGRVQMALCIGEKIFNNVGENGWRYADPSIVPDEANYICRFFYDYKRESLHQLKTALIL
ncbi:hypothetical protein KP509_04G060100 [Ceratopteris richardii]|uniref:BRCT domain-containing protein n=1 Tax=Ceratopteris richardii TaxID=49495 RepID=A0A8T2UTD8_CERRI|nr:hypothetical protein KP509_04G060100 [Ceratopteris richardii]